MQLLGITDEITACDCCGKTDLKKTFVIKDDNGNINYYGSTCYARIMGIKPKDSKTKIDGFSVCSAGRIQLRQHGREFYSLWCAGKIMEIIPITNQRINTSRIVLDWQKRDIEEWNKGNKDWFKEINSQQLTI